MAAAVVVADAEAAVVETANSEAFDPAIVNLQHGLVLAETAYPVALSLALLELFHHALLLRFLLFHFISSLGCIFGFCHIVIALSFQVFLARGHALFVR